jgi:carboxymethylenebutenolidase
MKKLVLLLLILPAISFAQIKSCCVKSATEKFTAMASTKEFASEHLAPLPFHFTPEVGSDITFDCADGVQGNAFEIKAAKPSENWLFIFHEWWGLNDYIKQEAEKWAKALPTVNVLAIDLYDGKVAETPESAQLMMEGLEDVRVRNIITGAINYTGKKASINTLGWCFGGGWALQAALMAGKKANSCVMYYGMPETDVKKLKKLNCEVLGIFATNDTHITPEVVAQFKKDMEKAGKKLTVQNYKADHAFANPSNPKYDKISADKANKVALNFLKTRVNSH